MTGPATVGALAADYASRLAAKLGTARFSEHADRLLADADRAELDAIRARQAANRHATYERRRPTRYADASYDGLRPEQDTHGLIRAWWDRGPRTLVIAGPARTGKTTAAYAIANHVHAAQSWVVATSAADLSADLKPDGHPGAYANATGCDLLVLDDLGRERLTEWWLDQLQRIVDARCASIRRLVVTINVEPPTMAATFDALSGRYGDPIAERIIDGGGIVVLDGPPVREVVTTW